MQGTLTAGARVILPGWHSWPAAPPHRSYLAALHRHLFIITAEVILTADHSAEFHDMQDRIREWWLSVPEKADRGSCESMACQLAGTLSAAGLKPVSVTVSEEDEGYGRWSA